MNPSSVRLMRPANAKARFRWLGVIAALVVLAAMVPVAVAANHGRSHDAYVQKNLVSDINGVARITDPNLVNPWGMAAGPTTPLWIADNGTDVSTLYTGGVHGSIPVVLPLVVTIPDGAPTGIVFNPTTGFVVDTGSASAPANFIFSSEAGSITAWSRTVSGTQAQVGVHQAHRHLQGPGDGLNTQRHLPLCHRFPQRHGRRVRQ